MMMIFKEMMMFWGGERWMRVHGDWEKVEVL